MIIDVFNSTTDFKTYRSERVKSLFNPERGNEFKISADIPIEGLDWKIGVIVGASGSGKTSIGRKIFNCGITDLYANWRADLPIIDCIAPEGDFNAVTGALASVGLGDVPSWLRPFCALSNGQQFRAGLARILVEQPDISIVDEFTSVVDRQIAKIGAAAFSKSWGRTSGKKIIFLTPHFDVLEWLQPDWVYNTNDGVFVKKGGSGGDLKSSYKFSRQIKVTGQFLSHIII